MKQEIDNILNDTLSHLEIQSFKVKLLEELFKSKLLEFLEHIEYKYVFQSPDWLNDDMKYISREEIINKFLK